MSVTHTVIIPYFSDAEVVRYLKIAEHMLALGPQNARFDFLLAASPLVEPSQRLQDKFSQLAPCTSMTCPTRLFGYPLGPTVMFWDCLDFVADHCPQDGGFCLWLESDMIPVKEAWLDRLDQEWHARQDALVMGCHVPVVLLRRFFRRSKPVGLEHINGGACYSKTLAHQIPMGYRCSPFDSAIFPYLQETGRYRLVDSLAFSTMATCRRDIADPRRVILHGFRQDKDQFIRRCVSPLTESERVMTPRSPAAQTIQQWYRRAKLRFLPREQREFETLLLEQEHLAARRTERPVASAQAEVRRSRPAA